MSVRFNVLNRLLVAFIGVSLVGALAAFFGLAYLGKLANQTDLLYAQTTEPLGDVFSLYGEVIRLSQAAVELGNLRDVENNSGSAERRSGKIDAALAALDKSTPAGEFRNTLDSFIKVWVDYKAMLGSLVAAAKAGEEKPAFERLGELQRGPGSSLPTLMSQILASFVSQGTHLAEASRATAVSSSIVVAILVLVSIVASIGLALILGRLFSRHLHSAVGFASRIATGELSSSCDSELSRRGDEFGDLSRALDGMAGALGRQMRTIQSSADELAAVGTNLRERMRSSDLAIAEVASAVGSVRGNIENQSSGVEETAATIRNMTAIIEGLDSEIARQAESVSSSSSSVEQMVGNIGSVGDRIGQLSSSFADLMGASEEGRVKLENVSVVVADISAQSEKLSEANSIVANIASKTNLLAMNAAIEAAHAGEAGKGFAVVADEIRNLAESASHQSKEISRDIGGIRKSIQSAVESSEAARQAFAGVIGLLAGVNALEGEINASLAEQREGSRLALDGLAAINEVTAKVRSGSLELRDGSKAIGTEMSELEGASLSLRDAAQGISRSVAAIEESSRAVSGLSERNGQAIEAVRALLSCYTFEGKDCVDPPNAASMAKEVT